MPPFAGDIASLAQRWLEFDRDSKTRQQVQRLLEANDFDILEKLLRNPIQFGTAGLRARLEAGFSRMNCVTVIQASQGLSSYVAKTVEGAKCRGVVVGHDHRHQSELFARLTAAVFLNLGYKVYFYRQVTPTPLVPFAVLELKAACGVMVTASHNPKDDNGYKVYWENGAQILPPHDLGIAASIAEKENQVPRIWDEAAIDANPNAVDITEDMSKRYTEVAAKLCRDRDFNLKSQLKYVYTAMHGVGAPYVAWLLAAMGLPAYIPVSSQIEPNPDFPTVAFPNPEEKGAFDEAKRVADECNVSLILANDPDADRFAAAEKQSDGAWHVFTGDQLGSIFAYTVLQQARRDGIPSEQIAMVNSTVSSRMLESIAKAEGFKYADTLTGFKWMANKLVDLKKEGYYIGFGYEEAIGYMIRDLVLDKDGVTALCYFAQLAAELHSQGKRVKHLLDDLYDHYGYYVSSNSYFTCSDPKVIKRVFDGIRFGHRDSSVSYIQLYRKNDGLALKYPKTIGGFAVSYVQDLTVGVEFNVDELTTRFGDSNNNDGVLEFDGPELTPKFPISASSQMITFSTVNGGRMTLRTSGTEPKIKYYLEMGGRLDQSREEVHKDLEWLVEGIKTDLVDAKGNGLN